MNPTAHLISASIASFIVASSFWLMARKGVLGPRAFINAPQRRGTLGVTDLVVMVGLIAFGQLAPLLAQTSASRFPSLGQAILDIARFSSLIALGYLIVRGSIAVERGWKGLGLDFRLIPSAPLRALVVFAAIFPALAATSQIITTLLTWLEFNPPTVAHDMLEEIVTLKIDSRWYELVFNAVVVAPMIEELIFRGFIQTAILQGGLTRNRWTAIAVTSFLFTAVHCDVAQPHALPLLYLLSIGLGWAYERWGNLWTPMLVHAMFNASQILIALGMKHFQNGATSG